MSPCAVHNIKKCRMGENEVPTLGTKIERDFSEGDNGERHNKSRKELSWKRQERNDTKQVCTTGDLHSSHAKLAKFA